nr:hypothetical protein [Tanacetum cinerariifolium]
MRDEHLNTISATKSDEFIKSCVENLVPNPSESEGENGCDVPACFTTFSNVLFDAEYEFDSSNDQSCSDEDVLEKIFSNPLFDEEIISMKIDQHHYNVDSDLIESMLNLDSSIIFSSSKIDSLLDEFVGELTLLKSIPPGIDKTDCDHENEICLIERLFDSLMEEIDLSITSDDPMPSGIEDDDYDSERDILILEELLDNYSLLLPVIELYHFDIPSFSRPPAKTPDGNTRILNIIMMGDISEQKVPIPGLMITLVSNQEKSPDLLSHQGLKIFQPSAKCPMMIHEKKKNILDVPLFHFYPLNQFKYEGNWVKLSDLKQALRGRDILILEELLENYSLLLPVIELYHFDIPSFSHPPAKPPDGNTRILNIKMMGDISEQKIPIPGLMITLVSNQQKSPDLLSHQGLKIFQPSAKCPMMIHEKKNNILDVPLFHFYPHDQFKYEGNWVKLSDLKQALRGRHPMLICSLVFSNE